MKSFLQGKNILDASPLRAPHVASSLRSPTACAVALVSGPSPQVDIVKQGDKIVRLIITCSCGERTEIECLYAPGLTSDHCSNAAKSTAADTCSVTKLPV